MPALLKSRCPHCQASVKVGEAHIGKRVRCPSCKQPFDATSVEFDLSASATLEASPAATETMTSSGAGFQPASDPAAASAMPTTQQLGSLGRFELKELLGQGAFGRVYRAYDPQLDRFVALKVPIFGPEDKHKINRFIAEAKAAARLRHPNIVPTYESGQTDGRYYIAAQFVAGQTLSKRLHDSPLPLPLGEGRGEGRPSPPDFRQTADWVRQLAEALAYAHSEGIVHRDIKPENIMLDAKGIPQIMDFGLAKRVNEDSAMTTDGAILGTPAYMAPEQARGDLPNVGPHSDQYSLGVVLYELLTGQKPFTGPPHSVIAQLLANEPPAPRTIRPTIPKDLEAICQKAMSKEPHQRFASAASLAEDLSHWLTGQPVSSRPLRPYERAARWARRNPTVAGLAASIILVASVALIIVSASLWSAVAAKNAARIALANEERQRREAADFALETLQRGEELRKSNEELKAEQQKSESERQAKEKTSQALVQSNEQLLAEKTKAEQSAAAEKIAKIEKAEEAEKAKASAVKEAAGGRRSAEQARASRMELVRSHWNQANTLLAEGNYAAGINYLARALNQLPDTDRPDSVTWNEILRMAIAAELASQPTILSRHDRPAEIAGFWQLDAPPAPNSSKPPSKAAKAASANLPFPRLIDSAGNIDGEAKKLPFKEMPIACLPIPENFETFIYHSTGVKPALNNSQSKRVIATPKRVINYRTSGGGYLIVYRNQPAQLMEIFNVDPKAEPQYRFTPFVSSTAIVRAFGRTSLVTGIANAATPIPVPQATELLVTILDSSSNSSIRVDRWELLSTTTPETLGVKPQPIAPGQKASSTPTSMYSGNATTHNKYLRMTDVMSLPEPVSKACLGAAVNQVVTASERRICLWNLSTKSMVAEAPISEPVIDLHVWPARNVLFMIAAKSVALLSYPDLKPLARYQHDEQIVAALLSPTGQTLVLADKLGRLASLDSLGLARLARPTALEAPFRTFSFRQTNDLAVIGAKTLRQWHLPVGQELVPPAAQTLVSQERAPIRAAKTALPSAAQWAVVAHDKHIASWVPTPPPSAAPAEAKWIGEFDFPFPVAAVAAHPTEPLFAVAVKNAIYLYNPAIGPQAGRWKQDGNPLREDSDASLTCLAFAATGSRLASGDDRGRVRIWDPLDRRRDLANFTAAPSPIAAVAFNGYGQLLAAAAGDTAILYDVEKKSRLPQDFAMPAPITSLALSQSGGELLVGCQDGTAAVFRVATGEQLGQPLRHSSAVTVAGFHPTGKFAYSIGGGGVQLIHVETGSPAGKFMRDIQNTANAALDATGKHALLAGRIFEFPAPIQGSPAEVQSVVEARLGAQLDNNGNLHWLPNR